jgi:hypothetical protein
VTTPDAAEAMFTALHADTARYPQAPMLWPLLISAWKRKQQ